MAKRRLNDYSSFVSARMRAISPHSQAEARAAMKQVAAEWRSMKHGHGGYAGTTTRRRTNPSPSRRRNPSGKKSWLPWAIGGAILYALSKRGSL